MKKILFVCHGNICRSAMGEQILRNLVKRREEKRSFSSILRR